MACVFVLVSCVVFGLVCVVWLGVHGWGLAWCVQAFECCCVALCCCGVASTVCVVFV